MKRVKEDSERDIGPHADAAIVRALDFLDRHQLPSGEFRTFTSKRRDMTGDCQPDPSVFPTALIAQSLMDVPQARSVRDRALGFLLVQRDRNGLWRHWTREHPHFCELPPDVDDSACASAALVCSGWKGSTDPNLLLANRESGGRFRTWIIPRLRWSGAAQLKATLPQLRHVPTLIAFFRGTSAAPGDVDAVVNANCLFYLGDYPGCRAVVEWLLGVLRDDAEASCDKWYDNPFIVRYFFARALSRTAPDAREPMLEKLARRPSNALELALTVSSLARWDVSADEAMIRQLLSDQREDGSWRREALYSGGRERRGVGGFAPAHPDTPHWGSEELSTALAIEALYRWREVGQR